MKNVKKLSAVAVVAALAAIPAVAGTPSAELPGAKVGYVLSVAYGKNPFLLATSGWYHGRRDSGLLGAIVGAA